jgi:hypothetical protein
MIYLLLFTRYQVIDARRCAVDKPFWKNTFFQKRLNNGNFCVAEVRVEHAARASITVKR